MGWKKEWAAENSELCPYCRQLIYPDRDGYVCRCMRFHTEKVRRKPDVFGAKLKLKGHDIYLFYHIDCHKQMTEEQLCQHFYDEAKLRGLK